jgi:mannose-6-phosphate isomerase class I
MAVVFNFVCRREPHSVDAHPTQRQAHECDTQPDELGTYVSHEEKEQADAHHDAIAQEMWNDYVEYIE